MTAVALMIFLAYMRSLMEACSAFMRQGPKTMQRLFSPILLLYAKGSTLSLRKLKRINRAILFTLGSFCTESTTR
jgi:hypothetical protein